MSWRINGEDHSQGTEGEKDLKNYINIIQKSYLKKIKYIASAYDTELCEKYNLNLGGTRNLADNALIFEDKSVRYISLKTLSGTIGWKKTTKFIDNATESLKYFNEHKNTLTILSEEKKKTFDKKLKEKHSKDLKNLPNKVIYNLLKMIVEGHDIVPVDIILRNNKTNDINIGEPGWFQLIRDNKEVKLDLSNVDGKESAPILIDNKKYGLQLRLKTNNGVSKWLKTSNCSLCFNPQQNYKKTLETWVIKQKN